MTTQEIINELLNMADSSEGKLSFVMREAAALLTELIKGVEYLETTTSNGDPVATYWNNVVKYGHKHG